MSRKFILAGFCLLAGCASNGPMRPQNLSFPIAGDMSVEVRLMQHDVYVSHTPSTAGSAAGLQMASSPNVTGGSFAAGAAAGLIGALVDAAIDAHRQSVANDAVKPMREHTKGIDMDALVCQSMDRLDKNLFAPSIQVDRMSRPEDVDVSTHQLKERANVLVLVPAYSVSYDGQTFTYALSAKLVDRVGNSNGFVADRIGGPRPRGQHVGQLGRLARERMRSRQPDIVRCGRGGRQIRVLGPQAQRLVRPDPVNDAHTKLPSDDPATQHANSGPAGARRETPTPAYLGVS